MRLTEKDKNMMVSVASGDVQVAEKALNELAIALELPLRKGVQSGDIISDIFEVQDVSDMSANTTVEYPLHFMSPGAEGEYVAFTLPVHGGIPEALIEGDYVQVPLYYIGDGIDWDLHYQKMARYDVVGQASEALRASFVQKMNDDGFHTVISAGTDRNLIVADSDSAAGQFSVRLVSLLKTVMRRNGGGNSTSVNRSRLTDLMVSPEGQEDMRSWNVDQVDEVTRREIFTSDEGTLNRIFNVNIVDLDELGEGQKYQLYFSNTLSGTLPNAGNQKLELCVGLDLSKNDSFVMPVGEPLQIRPDNLKLRDRKAGVYGWMYLGFGVLDSRRVLLGAF